LGVLEHRGKDPRHGCGWLGSALGSGTIEAIIAGAIEVENVAQRTQIALRLSRQ
jgi:hypothetical protein